MRKHLVYFIVVFVLSPFFCTSQLTSKDTLQLPTTVSLKKDTIYILQNSSHDTEIKNYQEILEKTNNQLSLWWNPYGIFVSLLGVLFAVLAIIATFLIYRQSKEYKALIKNSLDDHKMELEKLINEKESYLKNYEISLANSINEYKEKLNIASDENKIQLTEFISMLEEQKELIDSQIHIYKHSGWREKDIFETYDIDKQSVFYAKILLSQVGQVFAIYIRIVSDSNKKRWLGFAGDNVNRISKDPYEYTTRKAYDSKEIIIEENILSIIDREYPELESEKKHIDCIRLRGSNKNFDEITFSYKIT